MRSTYSDPFPDTLEHAQAIVASLSLTATEETRTFYVPDGRGWIDPQEGFAVPRLPNQFNFSGFLSGDGDSAALAGQIARFIQALPSMNGSKGTLVIETAPMGSIGVGVGIFIVDIVNTRAKAREMALERNELVYFVLGVSEDSIIPVNPLNGWKAVGLVNALKNNDTILYTQSTDTLDQPESGFAVMMPGNVFQREFGEELRGAIEPIANWVGYQGSIGCDVVTFTKMPLDNGRVQLTGVGVAIYPTEEEAINSCFLNGTLSYYNLNDNLSVEVTAIGGPDQ